MKKTVKPLFNKFILLLIIIVSTSKIYSQTWPWAVQGKSPSGGGYGYSLSKDGIGNIYVCGNFNSPSIALGSTTLNNTAMSSPFIAKYDGSGNLMWARTTIATGTTASGDLGNGIATDASGNSYLTGTFTSYTIAFGTYTLTNFTGFGKVFIVKYDPNGNVMWARTNSGSNASDVGVSATMDPIGNVIVTGYFQSPSVTFSTTVLNSVGNSEIFIVKYDTNGNLIWAKRAGGTGTEFVYSICSDAGGNSYISGQFSSSTITFSSSTLVKTGYCNPFLAKYDTNGNPVWAKTCTGNGTSAAEIGYAASVDPSGNIYFTGIYQSPNVTFGTFTLTNSAPPKNEIFVAKYNNTGTEQWVKTFGGNNDDDAYSISSNNTGAFLTGVFKSPSIMFSTYTLTLPITSVGPYYIVKFDGNGNAQCASVLNTGSVIQNAVLTGSIGDAFTTGSFFTNTMNVGTTTLTAFGTPDFYLAKYSCISTGLYELQESETIKIFPNPASEFINLYIPSNSFENTKILIVNILGQTVYESKISKGINQIHLKNTHKGIYSYFILEASAIINKGKLVIE